MAVYEGARPRTIALPRRPTLREAGLPALDQLDGPDVQLDAFGPELEKTLELLREVGFTT